MNELVHFEVTFKLRFQNFDFFQRNILLKFFKGYTGCPQKDAYLYFVR